MTDTSTPDPEAEAIQKAFERELNKHGHGFQYAVLDRARKLFDIQSSSWRPLASEVPVDQGPGTKIDFVLRKNSFFESVWMVAECKRVNPAFADWCFIAAPFTHERRTSKYDCLSIECLYFDPEQPVDKPRVHIEQRGSSYWLDKAYQVGIEIKTGRKGDRESSDKVGNQAIEGAATQVLRGLNGFVNTLVTYPEMLTYNQQNLLLPVILTTAQLWVSDYDLSRADLVTGEVDLSGGAFKQVQWLWYQYHTSPALQHSHDIEEALIANFEQLMDSQYIRTIAVVGKGGLDTFLQWSSQRKFT